MKFHFEIPSKLHHSNLAVVVVVVVIVVDVVVVVVLIVVVDVVALLVFVVVNMPVMLWGNSLKSTTSRIDSYHTKFDRVKCVRLEYMYTNS